MIRTFLIALSFIIAILLASSALPLSHSIAVTPAKSGYSLSSSVTFNQFGQMYVNETVLQNSSAVTGLNSITLGFPSAYQGHVLKVGAVSLVHGTRTNDTVTQGFANNTLTMTVSPALPAGSNSSVNLGFWVVNIYKNVNTSTAMAPVVFYPSSSVHFDKISSIIVTPYSQTRVGNSTIKGFGYSLALPTQTWTYTNSNVTSSALSFGNLAMDFSSSDSGSVDFQNLTRIVTVNPQGQIIVDDWVRVENLGLNTITALKYNVLTTTGYVTILPTSQPPLSNLINASVDQTTGEVDISGTGGISPNSTVFLHLQYPLSSSYWKLSHGVYHVTVPAAIPVSALVDYYALKIQLTSAGFSSSQAPAPIYATYASSVSGNVSLTYRQGIGSAFGFALPIAAIFFIAVFIAGMVFKPRAALASEEIGTTLEELVKVIEEKVSGTNDILSDLKSRGLDVTRAELSSARVRLDELRTKSGSRFASLRSEMIASSPESQGALSQVAANDREFDRAVRDMLNTYDQFISRRVKPDAFERVRTNTERRIQREANDLLDSIKLVRRSAEA